MQFMSAICRRRADINMSNDRGRESTEGAQLRPLNQKCVDGYGIYKVQNPGYPRLNNSNPIKSNSPPPDFFSFGYLNQYIQSLWPKQCLMGFCGIVPYRYCTVRYSKSHLF